MAGLVQHHRVEVVAAGAEGVPGVEPHVAGVAAGVPGQVQKREAEATWAAERVENALLRERINDVAAEVARLTQVLEGPGSRIDAILAEDAAAAASGNGAGATADAQARGSLADRIRALQNRASRLSSAR